MTQPYITRQPYRYNILNHEGEWEQWSGAFESKKAALIWYNKHGVYHEGRGHTIALFKNGVKVKLNL